jgi:hypothetical protein
MLGHYPVRKSKNIYRNRQLTDILDLVAGGIDPLTACSGVVDWRVAEKARYRAELLE